VRRPSVRILDENQDLRFQAEHPGDHDTDNPGWQLIPAQLPTSEVGVHEGDPMIVNVEEQAKRDDACMNLLTEPASAPAPMATAR
jgi:hypothetical protein